MTVLETNADEDRNPPVRRLADRSPARLRALADPARGDLLAVGTAGADGYETASTDTSRPRPAVYAIDGTESEPCVRRETIADLARCER